MLESLLEVSIIILLWCNTTLTIVLQNVATIQCHVKVIAMGNFANLKYSYCHHKIIVTVSIARILLPANSPLPNDMLTMY